jgi:hypothetical protein
MLQRESWQVGKIDDYRMYRVEGLDLGTKQPRPPKMVVRRRARATAQRPNEN